MATLIGIIDDDRSFVTHLTTKLEQTGYQVVSASSVPGALALLAVHRVHTLLLELRIGGTDGLQLLKRIQAKSPSTRIIVMTANASAEDYKQALRSGAVEVLSKPFSVDTLTAALHTASEHGFRGTLHGIGLVDLLQLLHLGRRSVSLHFGQGSKVHMKSGEVIHAEHGPHIGFRALQVLLATNSGSVQTTELESTPQTISVAFSGLMLKTMAAIDEHRGSAQPPPLPPRAGGPPPLGPEANGAAGRPPPLASDAGGAASAAALLGPAGLRSDSGTNAAQHSRVSRVDYDLSNPRSGYARPLSSHGARLSNHDRPASQLSAAMSVPGSGMAVSIDDALTPADSLYPKPSPRPGPSRPGARWAGALLVLALMAGGAYWYAGPFINPAHSPNPQKAARPAANMLNPQAQQEPEPEPAEPGADEQDSDAESAGSPKPQNDDTNQQIVLITEPAGLELRNAQTGASLGRSPIAVMLRDVELPLRVQAVTKDGLSAPVLALDSLPSTEVRRQVLDFSRVLQRTTIEPKPRRRRPRRTDPVRRSRPQRRPTELDSIAPAAPSDREPATEARALEPPVKDTEGRPVESLDAGVAPERPERKKKRDPVFETIVEDKPTFETVD